MFLNRIFSIGTYPDLTDKERKRVVLLNQIAFLGIVSIFIIGILSLIVDEEKRNAYTLIGLLEIAALLSIFYWQRVRKYRLARGVLLIVSYVFIFLLAKVVKTDVHNDYYFALLAILPLLFFDHKAITYGGLCLAIFCFYLDKEVKDLFTTGSISLTDQTNTAIVLFITVFLIVNYFKTLNEKNEKSLEQKSKELRSLNDFQSQFFINIAHEIRTPLTLIRGNNELLGEHQVTSFNPEVRKYQKTIGEQTGRIKKIVDDVLDIAKMKTDEFRLEREKVALDDFLKRVFFSFHTAFQQKSVSYGYKSGPDNCWLNVDPVYLERSLNNIILNALKYTESGGTVDIWYEAAKGNQAAIIIKDSGIGIPKELLPRIFERFFQADNAINKTGGSGIGLAFSREVVQMHGGVIQVDSTLGEGTVFRIQLPLAAPKTAVTNEHTVELPINEMAVLEETPLVPLLSNQSILIVDDHEDMRQYIEGLLTGYDCIHAEDGNKALSVLEQRKVDMVVTDYMMPNMNGHELIQQMKLKRIQIPILMLTARGDMNDKLEVLRLGIDDYMTKPFSKAELLIRIQNALLNHNEKRTFIAKEDLSGEEVTEDEAFLLSLKEYIQKSCEDVNFGLEDIVEEFATSKSTLYRKIKALSGLNPNQFINEIKLQLARSMVEQRKCNSVKQLSFAVGFSKPSYFSGLYEKRFGRRPFQES